MPFITLQSAIENDSRIRNISADIKANTVCDFVPKTLQPYLTDIVYTHGVLTLFFANHSAAISAKRQQQVIRDAACRQYGDNAIRTLCIRVSEHA